MTSDKFTLACNKNVRYISLLFKVPIPGGCVLHHRMDKTAQRFFIIIKVKAFTTTTKSLLTFFQGFKKQ